MEKLEIFKGQQLTFITPSGTQVTIREQSAEDDATLSTISGTSIKEVVISTMNRFIAGIVTDNNYNNKNHLTVEEVEGLKVRDKHYILLKSRIHSISDHLGFEYECINKNCRHKTDIEVDLVKTYDADLSRPLAEQETTEYTIKPYTHGNEAHFEGTLSSGKKIRMEYLTGRGEQFMLQAYENNVLSANTEYYARNLSYWNGAEWVILKSLNAFSKREAVELKGLVREHDTQFEAGVPIECPKCGRENFLPFISIPDFFFPAEM